MPAFASTDYACADRRLSTFITDGRVEQNWYTRNIRKGSRKADKTTDRQTERDSHRTSQGRQRQADRQTDKQASRQTDKHRGGHEAEQSQTQHPSNRRKVRERSNNKQADSQASTEGHRRLADGWTCRKPTSLQMHRIELESKFEKTRRSDTAEQHSKRTIN